MITNGVATASSTVVLASSLFRSAPGPSQLILSNASSAGTIYVGAGTGVTALNGYPLVAAAPEPYTVNLPAGVPGNTWSCIASAGTLSLAWTVIAAYGQTGTGSLG